MLGVQLLSQNQPFLVSANAVEDNMGGGDSPIHRIDMRRVSEKEAAQALKDHRGIILQSAKRLLPKQRVMYWIEFEDMVAIGEGAVLEAVASFDAERGAKLSTWVCHIVKRRMLEAVRRARGQSRIQQQTSVRLHMMKEGYKSTEESTFVPPTAKEVASLEEIQRVRTMSLERQDEEEPGLLDFLPSSISSPEEIASIQAEVRWLRTTMRRLLTAGERQALISYYSGEAGPDTADNLGVSRQRVQQLRDHALKKLQMAAKRMGMLGAPVATYLRLVISHSDTD